MSKRAQFWIGIIISVLCLGAVFLVVDLGAVLESLKEADWWAVLFIAAGQIGFLALRAWRWQWMLGGEQTRYSTLFHAQNIGYLMTSLLPFRLGDLARSYLAGLEPGISGVQALSTVVLERVLDMLVIVILFGIAASQVPALPEGMGAGALAVSAAAVIGFAGILLAAARRSAALRLAGWGMAKVPWLERNRELWLGRVESFLDGFKALTRWRLLIPVAVLSVLLWLCIVGGYYWGLKGFWSEVSWQGALFALCATAFGVTAPSSPGFVGVFHGAIVLGLSVFPVSREQAFGFAVVYHAVTTYLVNVGLGLVGLARSGRSLGAILALVRKEVPADA